MAKTKQNNDKVLERIETLYNEFDTDKGVLMILYVDQDEKVHSYNCGSLTDCAATVATAVDDAFDPHQKDNGSKFSGHALVEGVSAVIENGDISGIGVALRLLKALRNAVVASRNSISKALVSGFGDLVDAITDDDRKDEHEDCEHCENRMICPLPDAVAYRKANHLPNPNRKHGKKGNNHAN